MASTSLQDRVMITELTQAGIPALEIGERLGWRASTVRKWRRMIRRAGRQGLVSRLGRPRAGALSSFPTGLRQTLLAWRTAHPGWGPKTLLAELGRADAFGPLPSRAEVARWLRAEGLTRRYEHNRGLPEVRPLTARAPHEVWELDARGQEAVPLVGVVSLINLADRTSRTKLLAYPCPLGTERVERHPSMEDYRLVLRRAFAQWGLPDQLAVDRDSIFLDNTSKSPFPTRLHLWLIALGVDLLVGPPRRPTFRATIERAHQTWYHQVLQGQTFQNWGALASALDRRRDFLNQELPCASLGELPPLLAFPEARLPRRPYRPEHEAEALDVGRIHAYLGRGRWFRRTNDHGRIRLGQHQYWIGSPFARAEVEITFDPTQRELAFQAPDRPTRRLPLLGVRPSDLMGEAAPLFDFDHLQLALPITQPDERVLRLCETLHATN